VLQLFGWSSVRTRARDVATSVQQLTDELRALHDWKEHTENRKFTAHLLRALCFSAQAREQREDSYDRKNFHKNALKEYEDAVALRGNDLEALEGAAEQAAILGEIEKQLTFLNGIIKAAEGNANRLRRARAQRLSAMLMNLDPDPDKRKAARERLLDITQSQSLDVDNPAEREELAETFLSLGIIQAGRGRVPTAKRMLTRARTLFGKDTEGAKRANHELELLDPPGPADNPSQ
jgi:tetratricopeptide (TPR) repeat protein